MELEARTSCVRGAQSSVVATLNTVPASHLLVVMDMCTDNYNALSLHSLSIRFGAQSSKNIVAWVGGGHFMHRCVLRAQHTTLSRILYEMQFKIVCECRMSCVLFPSLKVGECLARV